MKNMLTKYICIVGCLIISSALSGMEEKPQKCTFFDKTPTSFNDLIKKADDIFQKISIKYEDIVESFLIFRTNFESEESWGFQPNYYLCEGDQPVEPRTRSEGSSRINPEYMNFRVNEYKIHLMPNTKDIPIYLEKLLDTIKNDRKLKKYICQVKAVVLCPEKDYGDTPKIVIYVPDGKKKAQYVLNKIYDTFKNEKGSGQIPGFNEKVTDFIFFAQGDRDDKNIWDLYEEPNKVYFDPQKIEKKFKIQLWEKNPDYHLKNPAK